MLQDQLCRPITNEINPAYDIWMAHDQMVLRYINNSLTPAILLTVARSTNSFTIWSSLAIRFGSQSQNCLLQLRGKHLRTMRGNVNVANFLDKINAISDNLTLSSSPMSDNDLVCITTSDHFMRLSSTLLRLETLL